MPISESQQTVNTLTPSPPTLFFSSGPKLSLRITYMLSQICPPPTASPGDDVVSTRTLRTSHILHVPSRLPLTKPQGLLGSLATLDTAPVCPLRVSLATSLTSTRGSTIAMCRALVPVASRPSCGRSEMHNKGCSVRRVDTAEPVTKSQVMME